MIRHIAPLVAVVALSLSTVACASQDEADGTGAASEDVRASSAKAAKFQIFTGEGGDFYFRFVAANGEKLLQSEGYTTRENAQQGVDAVLASAPDTHNVQQLESTSGQFYFVVKSPNGEIIATSETYTTKSSAQHGALVVRDLTRILADNES